MRQLIICILVIVGMASCELEPRILEFNEHDSKLALTAMLTPQDTLNAMLLTVSIGILDSIDKYEGDFLENGELWLHTPDQGIVAAYIYKDIEDYSEWETGVKLPLWKLDYNDFIEGAVYQLEARAENFESVTAICTVPSKPNLLDVKITRNNSNSGDYYVRDRFEISIEDKPDEKNYYRLNAKQIVLEEGVEYFNEYLFYKNASNPLDESLIDESVRVFSDSDFDGQEHTLILYGRRGSKPFEQVNFSLVEITKEEFQHTLTYDRNVRDNPFAEPVTYQSNIENGVGIFSISSPAASMLVDVE